MLELYYWPGIPGRGEFVRLLLEETGAEYVDVVREKGMEAMRRMMVEAAVSTPSFAPPFIRDNGRIIGQTPLVMAYLGEKLGLAPEEETGRWWAVQIQQTIADLTSEAHDVHHPLGADKYYEEQMRESAARAVAFRTKRIPKFLHWFERILARNPDGAAFLVGERLTHADISLFHVVDGLRYAFPNAMREAMGRTPAVAALYERVKERPRIAAYLASDRRQPFNEDGIFRHYPELDGASR